MEPSATKTSALEREVLYLLLIAVGAGLGCKALEVLAFATLAEHTDGVITSVAEKPHQHGKSYTVTYDFITPAGATFSGRSGWLARRPALYGRVKVAYIGGYPRLNHIQGTKGYYVIAFVCLLGAALACAAFGASRFIRGRRPARVDRLPPLDGPGPQSMKTGLLVCAAVGLGLVGYGLSLPGLLDLGGPVRGELEEAAPGEPGNAPGNLNNSGYFASQGEWLYYVDFWSKAGSSQFDAPVYRAKPDGSKRTKIADGPAQCLNVVGDRVYFMKWESGEGDRIYSAPVLGGKAKRLLKTRVKWLQVRGEWMFFTSEFDDAKLYRARANGSQAAKLNDDASVCVNVSRDWIYYANDADSKRIYRIRTNGKGRERITQDSALEVLVQGDWVYYTNDSEDAQLYRIKVGGAGREKLAPKRAHWLNTDGQWLYFSDYRDDGRLYRMPLAGGEPAKVVDASCLHVHVAMGHLYFAIGELLSAKPYQLAIEKLGAGPAKPTPF